MSFLVFQSLNQFLPQFKSSCEEVQREVEETGTTRFAVEELLSESDSSSSSESESSSSSVMSVEDEEDVPVVEMV